MRVKPLRRNVLLEKNISNPPRKTAEKLRISGKNRRERRKEMREKEIKNIVDRGYDIKSIYLHPRQEPFKTLDYYRYQLGELFSLGEEERKYAEKLIAQREAQAVKTSTVWVKIHISKWQSRKKGQTILNIELPLAFEEAVKRGIQALFPFAYEWAKRCYTVNLKRETVVVEESFDVGYKAIEWLKTLQKDRFFSLKERQTINKK